MIDFLWWVAVKSWPDRVSDCLCLYVCPSIFESGEKNSWADWDGGDAIQHAGRGKDDGAHCRAIGLNRHVPPREPSHDFIIRCCSSYYWAQVNETL